MNAISCKKTRLRLRSPKHRFRTVLLRPFYLHCSVYICKTFTVLGLQIGGLRGDFSLYFINMAILSDVIKDTGDQWSTEVTHRKSAAANLAKYLRGIFVWLFSHRQYREKGQKILVVFRYMQNYPTRTI